MTDFQKRYAELRAATPTDRLQELADLLGLPGEAVGAMPYAWYPAEDCWVCAEVGPDGMICGLERRYRDGSKMSMAGGNRGLFMPTDFNPGDDVVFVVEGASDTAAALAMGLKAVGRPSNRGGKAALAQLLRGHKVLIVGENDQKQSGDWPGKDGAVDVSDSLAETWGEPVGWCLPPAGAKDMRGFYHEHGEAGGTLLREHFNVFVQTVKPSDQGEMRFGRIGTPATESNSDPFVDVPLGELGPSEPPDYVWPGYAAMECVTLLTAAPKAGKTTLLRSLLKDLYGGGGMVQRPPMEAPTLIVSEESAGMWSRHRDGFGLDHDLIRVVAMPFKTKPSNQEWERLVFHVAKRVEELGAGLVIFDTISNLWPVRDENDAAAVGAALMPVRQITEEGAALILVHHDRKGGGQYGEGTRGSSALTGFADAIVNLRRFKPEDEHDTRRKLSYVGRFDDTEPEVVLDFDGDGYTCSGRPAEVETEDLLTVIFNALPENGDGIDTEAIYAEVKDQVGKTKLKKLLSEGSDAGRWVRCGTGRKGDAYLFSRPKCDSVATPSIRPNRIPSDLPVRREAI